MANNKQQPVFRSSFLTMDSTLVQDNNTLLYFRNMQGPRDSSNNVFFSLQSAIGADPSIRINKHNSTGAIVQTGYLLDTEINQLVDPTFSTCTIVGNGSAPQTLFDISSSTCKINVINTTGGYLDTNFCDNINDANGLNIDFFKTRNYLQSSNGDTIGSINFYGRSVTNNDIRAAYIAGVQDDVATSTNVPGRIEFVTRNASGVETEKMRIDKNNILIKGDTISASAANPFGGSSDNGQVIITGTTTQLNRLGMGIDTVNSVGIIQAVTSANAGINLALNPAGGNIGLGLRSPQTKVQIGFNVTFAQDWFFSNGTNSPTGGFGFYPSLIGRGMSITSTGTTTITTYSDGVNAYGGGIGGDSNGTLDFFTSFIPSGSGGNVPVSRTFNDLFRMRIDSTGKVGIGLSTPLTALDVSGVVTIRNNFNNANAYSLTFAKSRNLAQTSNNDELGYIDFYGEDTANIPRRAAYILANQGATSGATFVPGKMSFNVTDTTGTNRSLIELNPSKQVVLPDTTAAATGPNLNFNKSRSGGQTSINDSLGQVVFNGVDTTATVRRAAYIETTQDTTPAGSIVGGKMVHYTTNSTGTEAARLTVESDGVTYLMNIRSITGAPAANGWGPYYNKVLFVQGPATSFNLTSISPVPDAGATLTFRNTLGVTLTINATNPASVTVAIDGTAKFVYVTSARVSGLSGWYQIQ